MIWRKIIVSALALSVLSLPTMPQDAARDVNDVESQVLDLLFHTNAESAPYYMKLVLRFSDDDSQVALIVYPGGHSELVRSSLSNMSPADFHRLISDTLARNPVARDEDIATSVRISTVRYRMEYSAVEPELNELKAIRISPLLDTRVGVDAVSYDEYWFASGQESVHYRIFDRSGHNAQDQLSRWMDRFRSNLPNIEKDASKTSEPQ
jgi:hypothetical protein